MRTAIRTVLFFTYLLSVITLVANFHDEDKNDISALKILALFNAYMPRCGTLVAAVLNQTAFYFALNSDVICTLTDYSTLEACYQQTGDPIFCTCMRPGTPTYANVRKQCDAIDQDSGCERHETAAIMNIIGMLPPMLFFLLLSREERKLDEEDDNYPMATNFRIMLYDAFLPLWEFFHLLFITIWLDRVTECHVTSAAWNLGNGMLWIMSVLSGAFYANNVYDYIVFGRRDKNSTGTVKPANTPEQPHLDQGQGSAGQKQGTEDQDQVQEMGEVNRHSVRSDPDALTSNEEANGTNS